jgi:glyceraldehyde 3-phosphate dehydrogenase
MAKIGINGFGRIGRLAFRSIRMYHNDMISAVAANGSSTAKTNAHLIKWDSVYGQYPGTVEARENCMIIDGEIVEFYSTRDPLKIPWAKLGVDIVLDCTGTLNNSEQLKGHFQSGAKNVIISAPSKIADITVVMGVNEKSLDPGIHRIISAGSCTSNCITPIARVLHNEFGISKGFFNTIHAYTGDQRLLDRHHEDLRRARSAAINMVPTTTGAAQIIGKVIPELQGKIKGIAIRVPVPSGSLVEFIAELNVGVTAANVNEVLREYAQGPMKGIMEYSEEELVSSDYVGNTSSAIIDAASTEVTGRNMIRVLAWYDNEWGYCCRLADLADYLAQKINQSSMKNKARETMAKI